VEEVIAMKTFRTLIVLAAVAALAVSVASAQAPAAAKPNLKNPAAFKEQAPAMYKASFETSAGTFVVEVHRDWAPIGADRFYNLVKSGFFENVRFFRVIPGFMVQFGMHGDPAVGAAWRTAAIKDDPVKQSNKRGYITFATAGPNTRTTQIFINFADNASLDGQGFAPFGQVVSGMDVVDKLNASYGARPGDDQGNIAAGGNAYLEKTYPKLDLIKKATIVK
jgi:peptidyl-prolyl cis-trans isomerase A (cyclophilin A)